LSWKLIFLNYTNINFHCFHRKFGVSLVAIRPAILPEFYEDSLLLNPGPGHILNKSDICFYLSITKEEDSSFAQEIDMKKQQQDKGRKSRKYKLNESLTIEENELLQQSTHSGLLLKVPKELHHHHTSIGNAGGLTTSSGNTGKGLFG
jgi:hypothetical protein